MFHLLRLRFSTTFSRTAVYLVFAGTIGLGSTIIYQRKVQAEPMRFGRDTYGTLRWMTKYDILLMGIQDIKAQLMKDPNNEELKKALEILRTELRKEKQKNQISDSNSGNAPANTDEEIEEEELTNDDLVLK